MGVQEKQSVAKRTTAETLTTQERRIRAWGNLRPVSETNKIGIKRHHKKLHPGHPFAHVTRLDRWLVKKMIEGVGNPSVTLILWNGEPAVEPASNSIATLVFHDRGALLKTILDPELHFGDLYSSGRVEFEGDLVEFMQAIYNGIVEIGQGGWIRKFFVWLGHRRIANSVSKARDNIYHHYDLGNTFYDLWLDKEAMQYTCAYFPDPTISLEQAQIAKLHHVCRKLQLKPGDSVVEAGCGWGGLARFMAKHYGVSVKAYNISKQQIKFARAKAEAEGLSDKVEYVEDDYRNITGEFDVFVSIGMLEHVGVRDYNNLSKVIDGCLKADGRGLIHSIGQNFSGPMNAWVERRIFPGAYPPTLAEMMGIFEPSNFSVTDVENLRLHYSKTLEHWLARLERHESEVVELMDEAFMRAWRLYLAGSISAFNCGELQLFQVVFSRGQHNQLPWSRAHLYTEQEPC